MAWYGQIEYSIAGRGPVKPPKSRQANYSGTVAAFPRPLLVMGAYEWITGAAPKRCLDNGALFVSGAYPRKGSQAKAVEQFSFEFGKRLAEREGSLVSGNGPTVGNSLINGIHSVKHSEVFQYIILSPFKQHGTVADMTHAERSQYYYHVRQDLIAKANIIVFLSGEKVGKDGQLINSDTVLTEYSAGMEAGRFPIPIAIFGGSAAIIHQRIRDDIKKKVHAYKDLPEGLFESLADPELPICDVIDAVFAIVDWLVQTKLRLSSRRSSVSSRDGMHQRSISNTSITTVNTNTSGWVTNPRSPSSAAVSRQASYASTSGTARV